MDIFDSPYYRMNKILLTGLGLWPYQPTLQKHLIRAIYLVLVSSIIIPMFLRLIEVWGYLDSTMECASTLFVQFVICFKLVNYIFRPDMMAKLMSSIEKHWKSDLFQPQLEIFHEYARKGQILTQLYTAFMYSVMATFILMPMVPKIMDILYPLNESRPLIYPLPMAYGNIDMDKHYNAIILHNDCGTFLAVTTFVAIDTSYMVYVQHACGMFAALGDRLQCLMKSNEQTSYNGIDTIQDKNDVHHEARNYQAIGDCVKMHKKAINYANTIETSYTMVFLLVVGTSVICISISGYRVVMNFDKPEEIIRSIIFVGSQVLHMFFVTWPGQQLIDHSERIHHFVYAAWWYEASPRSKKLLTFMMMRSFEPCKLTAGKLFDLSFVTFTTVMKSSMSYFTVLTSMD